MAMAARGERRGLLGVVAVIAFAILLALGIWQIQRLAWKQDLIARVEQRTELSPQPAPGPEIWPALDYDQFDYLPVLVVGEFDHDNEVHAYVALGDPKGPLGGQGYFILTPVVTEDGWVVLVNRGFVPEDRKDPATRLEGQIDGRVEITGLLRPPQTRNRFTPSDDPKANIWFTRGPAAIGVALEIDPDRLAPYYVDAVYNPDLPDGLPQGGETIVSFSNNHLQYVVTWLGLAAALAVISVLRIRSSRRSRPESRSG